jgi:hypothetical protein
MLNVSVKCYMLSVIMLSVVAPNETLYSLLFFSL